MANIHPTAIVDPLAELDASVEVGPYCVVRGHVRIGAGSRLVASVHLDGPMTIGRRNIFYPFACIGSTPQDRKFDADTPGSGTTIGDDNVIRESVTISRATGERPTELGNHNYLMINAHLGHDVRVGNHCTLTNNVALGGHVVMADGAMFGGNSGAHQFCRLGRLCMISGGVAVIQDVPPFCVVHRSGRLGSLNLVGLRRAGLRGHVEQLKRAFDLLFRLRLPNSAAAARIEAELGDDPLCMELARFVADTKRGLTGYAADTTGSEARET